MAKVVLFTNYTNEDFTHTWGKEPYFFPKGRSIYLDRGIAETMAVHLIDRELNKEGLPTDHFSKNARMLKCFTDDSFIEAQTEEKVETDRINANKQLEKKGDVTFCSQCDSKGVRHKKDCPTLKEEVFEGLNNEIAE